MPDPQERLDDIARQFVNYTGNGYTNWYEISEYENVKQLLTGGYSALDAAHFDGYLVTLGGALFAYVETYPFRYRLSGPLGEMWCFRWTLSYNPTIRRRRVLRRYMQRALRRLRAESNPERQQDGITKIENFLRECRDGRTLQDAESLFQGHAAWLMAHTPDDIDAMRELLRVQAELTERMHHHPTPSFMKAYRALEQRYETNRRESRPH